MSMEAELLLYALCEHLADNSEGTVEVYKKRINLPKIGWIRMREELQWTGEITKVSVKMCPNSA